MRGQVFIPVCIIIYCLTKSFLLFELEIKLLVSYHYSCCKELLYAIKYSFLTKVATKDPIYSLIFTKQFGLIQDKSKIMITTWTNTAVEIRKQSVLESIWKLIQNMDERRDVTYSGPKPPITLRTSGPHWLHDITHMDKRMSIIKYLTELALQ